MTPVLQLPLSSNDDVVKMHNNNEQEDQLIIRRRLLLLTALIRWSINGIIPFGQNFHLTCSFCTRKLSGRVFRTLMWQFVVQG